MSYDFLEKFSEEVVCWYLTIETEYGKPPYLVGSDYIAGRSIDDFQNEELLSVPGSLVRKLTCGVLLTDGTFNTWDRIDQRRAELNNHHPIRLP